MLGLKLTRVSKSGHRTRLIVLVSSRINNVGGKQHQTDTLFTRREKQ